MIPEVNDLGCGLFVGVLGNSSSLRGHENTSDYGAMVGRSSNDSLCQNGNGDLTLIDDDFGGGGDAGEYEAFLRIGRIVIPVIFGLIAVLGFTGNLAVIIIVTSNKQMRNTTNILIINLALADLAFILICVPFTAASYVVDVWPFGRWWCKISQYAIHVTAHESVYTLVLMSFDRYLAVVHPISSLTLRTERNALIALGALWFANCAANSPALEVFDIHYEETRSTCLNVRLMNDPDYGKLFYGTFFFFAFLLPLALVTVLYGFLIRRLLYHERSRNLASSDNLRAKRRVTRMVIIVVVIFAVCWLPLHALFLAQFFGPSDAFSQSLGFLAVKIAACCLAYMNSCVNPILYAFLSEAFRQNFRRLFSVCFGGCRRSTDLRSSGAKTYVEMTTVRGPRA